MKDKALDTAAEPREVVPFGSTVETIENIAPNSIVTTAMGFICGGVSFMVTTIPAMATVLMTGGSASPFIESFQIIPVVGGLVGWWLSSKALRTIAIDEHLREKYGSQAIGSYRTFALRRTFKQKRTTLPIKPRLTSVNGTELVQAVLVTDFKGHRLEITEKSHPLVEWDKHIATVKELHSINVSQRELV